MSVAKASGFSLQDLKSLKGLSPAKRDTLRNCALDAARHPYRVTKQSWSAPSLKPLRAGHDQRLTVSWSKSRCSGYQIAFCTNRSFHGAKVIFASGKSTSASTGHMAKNKTLFCPYPRLSSNREKTRTIPAGVLSNPAAYNSIAPLHDPFVQGELFRIISSSLSRIECREEVSE